MHIKSSATRKAFILALFSLLVLVMRPFAQKAIDVNLLTGAAQASIPLGVLTAGDISYPISFNYFGGGLKVDDYGQRYGLGWSFSAEAGIMREVRGFPDDVELTSGSTTFKGWIRTGSAASAVHNFTISNDNNTSTCSDEVTDYSYMNSNIPAHLDSEPDIFTVDVPGLGFQFVFDKDTIIRTIPFRDVKIEYAKDPNTKQINSFTITNDRGIKYIFSNKYWTYRHIDENVNPLVFKREYDFYHHTGLWVEYTSKWYLSYIIDTKQNQLSFTYTVTDGDMPKFGNDNLRIVKWNTSAYQTQDIYVNKTSELVPRIQKISVVEGGLGSGTETGLDFAYRGAHMQASLHEMKFLRSGLIVWLDVRGPYNKTNDATKPGRYFLENISLTSAYCASFTQKYRFTYNNVDFTNNTSYCTNVDSITNAQDYWGYYNGATSNTDLYPPVWVYPDNASVEKYKIVQIPGYSGNVVALTGSNRSVTSSAVAGTLKRIYYPNGGVCEVEYDNNEYFDADVNAAVLGGGVRVRKITHNDGLNTNEVTYYDYNDPSTSVTTGKAISTPDFTIAFPNSNSYSTLEDRVKNSTYRTLYDYSGERNKIIYGKVTVRKTNGGKSIYEFNTSGVRRASATGDWVESTVNITRPFTSSPNPCTAIEPSFLTNGKNIYPFPVNANFDFERGLISKISQYNESGGLIAEESYTYGYSHSNTTKIAALKFDDLQNLRGYTKYNVLAIQDNLIATRTTKTYNASSPTSGVYTQETETFTYPSPSGSDTYRLPTMIQKQNSDGKTNVTRMKYAKDYTTTGTGDDGEKGIHRLKEIGYNALIESYQSVIESSTEKYVSGSIIKYRKTTSNEFATNIPVPYETYAFAEPNGNTSFTASSISSNTFTFDSKYYKTSTVTQFNDDGNPGAVTNNSRRTNSVLYSYPVNLKVAEFANAKQEEILFTNFDYATARQMTGYSGGYIVKPGRFSKSCLTFNTGVTLTGDIEKVVTNQNIMYSCWVKRQSSSDVDVNGTLTITLTGTGFSQSYYLAYTAGVKWKYIELRIPKPSPQTLTVSVSTNAGIMIDDILVYPDNTSVKTNSFTQLTAIKRGQEVSYGTHLTAETGMNGTTRYYDYSTTVGPYLIKDVDENIVQINELRRPSQTEPFAINSLSWGQPVQAGIAANIDAYIVAPCDITVTYTWDFGDGSSQLVTTTPAIQHTYTTAGSYTLSCTISASGYTSHNFTPMTQVVVHGAPVPTLCLSGVLQYTASPPECALGFCTEGGHTPTCTETKFRVTSLAVGAVSDITNWHWEKAPVGSGSWSTVSNGAYPLISISFSTSSPVTQSYKVRCTVTLVNGTSATSAEYTVLSN